MKRLLTLFTVAFIATSLATSAKAVTLIGGSTNNGYMDGGHAVEVVPGFFLPQPNVWINNGFKTISGPYQDNLDLEPWAGPAPTPVTNGNLLNPPNPDGCGNTATDGDCGVFFKAFGGNIGTGDLANGILSQNVPATAGKNYQMQGWAGAEANYSGLIPATVTQSLFKLEFLNASNGLISAATLDLAAAGLGVPNGQPFNYKNFILSANAPAGTASVTVSVQMLNGYSNPAGGGQAFVIDDLSLNENVPEPTTFTLGALAIAGLFGFVRRR